MPWSSKPSKRSEYKRRHNDKSRVTAFNERKPWTAQEIEAVKLHLVSDRELSITLGRSRGAILAMRHRVRYNLLN